MTMNCPSCGSLMIWLNGSISHETSIKYYKCRKCQLNISKYPDETYEIKNNE